MLELDILKFRNYNPLEEIKEGEYWKFTVADNDQIDKLMDFFSVKLGDVIAKVSDCELKSKMKERIVEYINRKGVTFSRCFDMYSSDLFNSEEIYNIISQYLGDFKNDILTKIQSNEVIKPNNISSFLGLYTYLDDDEFKINDISKLIEIIKPVDNFQEILIQIFKDFKKRDEVIYFYFFDKYYNLLPMPYQNYLRILNNSDSDYLLKKNKKFLDMDINIGIDPDISIGVEIETDNCCGLESNEINSILSEQREFKNLFVVDCDGTVSSGIEVKSGIFNDNVLDVSKFCTVCEFMSELGCYYDEKLGTAAGQINLGLDYLDSSRAILNFYELFGNCEELLFYISNESGQLIRQSIGKNSRFRPLSEVIGSRVVDEDISREDVIKLFNSSPASDDTSLNGLIYKKNTVCLRGYCDGNYRLEFRIPNGGVNYKTWIDNIRLYGKMMEVSKNLANALNKEYLSKEEENKLNIYLDLQNDELNLSDKLILLMDLLFEDSKIKQIYYDRFKSVVKKIKETNSQNYNVPVHSDTPLFGKVNFEEKYESKLEDVGNISYDPETGIYEEDGIRNRI